MTCPKCGSPVDNGSLFCANCGTRLTPAPQNNTQSNTAQPNYSFNQQPAAQGFNQQQFQQPQQPQFQQQFGYGNQQQFGGMQPPAIPTEQVSPKNPVWAAVYNTIKSPLFVIAASLLTLTFILNLVSSFASNSSAMSDLYWTLYWELGLDYSIIDAIMQGMNIGTIIGSIPSFVINLGVWLTFFLVAFSRFGNTKTGGLTTVKVILIIEEVFLWIAMFLVEIILLIATIAVSVADYGYYMSSTMEIARIVFIVLLILVPGIYVLCIAFYKGLRHSINTAKDILKTGKTNGKISMFAAVMCFIFGGIMVFSTLMMFISGSANAITLIVSLLNTTLYILFGIILASCRGKINKAMTPTPVMQNNTGFANVPPMPHF